MYIAFKWLIVFSLVMWVALCYIDSVLNLAKQTMNLSTYVSESSSPESPESNNTQPTINVEEERVAVERRRMKPVVHPRKRKTIQSSQQVGRATMMCTFSCILIATILGFNRDVVSDLKTKKLYLHFMKTAKIFYYDYCHEYVRDIQDYLENIYDKFKLLRDHTTYDRGDNTSLQYISDNRALVKEIKDIHEEKRTLKQLLIAAMNENKHVRKEFAQESMLKNNLMKHIHHAQKLLHENKLRHINCQHLYWLTSQENNSLREKLRTLTESKDDIQKKLMDLMREVFQTDNSKLKAFCSHMIVHTSDNNNSKSKTSVEIQRFLQRSNNKPTCSASWGESQMPHIDLSTKGGRKNASRSSKGDGEYSHSSFDFSSRDARKPSTFNKMKSSTDNQCPKSNDRSVVLNTEYRDCDVTKCKYFWNVYNEPEFLLEDQSVMSDNDCLVKYSNWDLVSDTVSEMSLNLESAQPSPRQIAYTNPNIVTGSEVFRKFLETTKRAQPLTPTSEDKPLTPPFLCG